MEIRVWDGKRERVYQVNGRHQDGTQIDFSSPDHSKRLNEAYIRGAEAVGYKHETMQIQKQGAI